MPIGYRRYTGYVPGRRTRTLSSSVRTGYGKSPYRARKTVARRYVSTKLNASLGRSKSSRHRAGRVGRRRTTMRRTRARKTTRRRKHTRVHRSSRGRKTNVTHSTPFYTSGGRKPSAAFKAKIEESLSNPVVFGLSTGNVIQGAPTTTYETAQFVQPHLIAAIGTPPLAPTPITSVPVYLYDYNAVAIMLNTLYGSIGTSATTLKQTIRVSGHMEYNLQNMTSQVVRVDCIRWSIKAQPGYKEMSMTDPLEPDWITNPVYTGNPINLIGRAIFMAGMGGAANATNIRIDDSEINLKMLPVWCQYMDFKQFRIKLAPGKSRKFTVGRKLLAIDTIKAYSTDALVDFSNQNTWNFPFIPGACGFLFRIYGEPAIVRLPAALTGINDPIAYSQPELTLTTRVQYTAFDWLAEPEEQGQVFVATSGIVARANNQEVNVNVETGVPTVVLTA